MRVELLATESVGLLAASVAAVVAAAAAYSFGSLKTWSDNARERSQTRSLLIARVREASIELYASPVAIDGVPNAELEEVKDQLVQAATELAPLVRPEVATELARFVVAVLRQVDLRTTYFEITENEIGTSTETSGRCRRVEEDMEEAEKESTVAALGWRTASTLELTHHQLSAPERALALWLFRASAVTYRPGPDSERPPNYTQDPRTDKRLEKQARKARRKDRRTVARNNRRTGREIKLAAMQGDRGWLDPVGSSDYLDRSLRLARFIPRILIGSTALGVIAAVLSFEFLPWPTVVRSAVSVLLALLTFSVSALLLIRYWVLLCLDQDLKTEPS